MMQIMIVENLPLSVLFTFLVLRAVLYLGSVDIHYLSDNTRFKLLSSELGGVISFTFLPAINFTPRQELPLISCWVSMGVAF